MNRYRITFTDHVERTPDNPRGFNIVVVAAEQEAKNGLDAIRAALKARGVTETDILSGRTVGSNKRLVLYGITFEANKV
jgi:hypothetical protein